MDSDIVFGFVPSSIVEGLRSFGNWQVRQRAIDALQCLIQNTDLRYGSSAEIPQFFDFLTDLMNDPNFKIKQGSIATMTILVNNIGKDIEFYIRDFMPNIVEKLADPKAYVREGCVKVFKAVFNIIGATKSILILRRCFHQFNTRIRAAITLLYIMAVLLTLDEDVMDRSAVQYVLSVAGEALTEAVRDANGNVVYCSMEGLRLLHSRMSSTEFESLLKNDGMLSEYLQKQIRQKCQQDNIPLPYLTASGYVVVQLNSAEDPVKNPHNIEIAPGSTAYLPQDTAAKNFVSDDCKQYTSNNCTEQIEKTQIRQTNLEKRDKQGLMTIETREKRTVGIQDPKNEEAEKPSVMKSAFSDQLFFRRLLQNMAHYREQPLLPESTKCRRVFDVALESSQRHSSDISDGNITPNTDDISSNAQLKVDRIGRMIHKDDDCPRQEQRSIVETTPSSMLTSKRKHNLHFLKMKQKDRRTHSASAVLQRISTSDTEIDAIGTDHSLPDIHSKHLNPSMTDQLWTSPPRSVAVRNIRQETSLEIDEDNPDCFSSPGSATVASVGTCTNGTIASMRLMAIGDIADTEPFIDADAVVQSTIDRLKAANNARKKEVDWISQVEALNDARRLVYHHPLLIKKNKRDFIGAFQPAMTQLRSNTARTAIILCQEVFEAFGDSLEHEIDDIVPLLLRKSGETSNAGRDTFLASEADKALKTMIRNVSFVRSLNALLQNANNASKYIRSKVAAHLDDCLHLASAKLKSSAQLSLIDRLFKTAVAFLEEGSLDTRTYGKRILWELKMWINNRGAFERLLGQLETDNKIQRVRDVVEHPDGPPPVPHRSTRQQQNRRTCHGNGYLTLPSEGERSEFDGYNMETRTHAESEQRLRNSTESRNLSQSMKRPPRPRDRYNSRESSPSSESLPETFSTALSHLCSKDWRVRIDALRQIESMAGRLRQANDRDILNTMDQLTYRLNDGNSKVILTALETLRIVFDNLGKRVLPSLNTVVPAVVSNLASSSDKIRSLAESALDQLIANVDGVYLVQNLSHCCTHGNHRPKAILLSKLERIVPLVHSRKPSFVLKYILPVAFSSLGDIWLDVREANARLIRTLARIAGTSFMEKAEETLADANRRRLFDILQASCCQDSEYR